jgi:hypothetical protein
MPEKTREKKVRRKRPLKDIIEIDGYKLQWHIRSEPQLTSDGWEGLSIEVERTDGNFRKLILEYPFPKLKSPQWPFPLRPKISRKFVESDIREAMKAGWNPDERGGPCIIAVPLDPG